MMYSNYLNTTKKSSTLRYKPPGFEYPIDIPFPGRVLPVCARCKKNYKTREHCRTKEGHNGLPWTDTYICITFDGSCFASDGQLHDGPFFVQGVQSQPYIYPDTKTLDPKTPSCAQCKDKNYTRTYCRTSKKHKTLPWSTVYVVLSYRADAAGQLPPPDLPVESKKRRKGNNGKVVKEETPAIPTTPATSIKTSPSKDAPTTADESKETPSEVKDESAINASPKAKDESSSKEEDTSGEKPAASTQNEDEKEKDIDNAGGDLKRKEPDSNTTVGEVEAKKEIEEKVQNIFQNVHVSRTFLSTVSVEKNDAEWVELDQNQLTIMQHRQKQEHIEAHEQAYPHSPYGQMPAGMSSNGMHPGMGMNMHPGMGHFPIMQGGVPGGVKEETNNRAPGPMENQWGMQGVASGAPGGGAGGNPHMGNGFPMPQDIMYNSGAAQMMDPRMGGSYGFHNSWHPAQRYPMDMQGMQGGQPYGQMSQMPYDPQGMQMPWGGAPNGPPGGGGGPDMGVNGGGGNGSGGMMPGQGMPSHQGMPHQGMSPHSGMPHHQGMSPHQGMPHRGMPPSQDGMTQQQGHGMIGGGNRMPSQGMPPGGNINVREKKQRTW